MHMRFDNWKIRVTQWFLEKGLGAPADVSLLLGNRVRKWSPYIRIETRALWAAEPLSRKIRAIARGRWQQISSDIAQKQALETYSRAKIFGTVGATTEGNHLLVLCRVSAPQERMRSWESLTDADKQRAIALASFTILPNSSQISRCRRVAAQPPPWPTCTRCRRAHISDDSKGPGAVVQVFPRRRRALYVRCNPSR